jgi:hypothetical protein
VYQSVPKHAHRATLDEIRHNELNLNIPRYVDTSEGKRRSTWRRCRRTLTGWNRSWRRCGRRWRNT